MERDLRRLRDRPAEEPERDEVHCRRREPVDIFEDAEVGERAGLPDEQDEPERERRVADRVHHERLLRGRDCLRLLMPEPDEQVRREPDEPPADEQQEEVPRLHEHEHREDEERHVGEVATLLVVACHVPHRVPDDEPADARDDEHHRARERVEQDLELDLEVARLEPGVRGGDDLAVGRVGRPQAEEGDERAAEREEGRERGDVRGGAARDPRPRERDRDRPRERRQQADPGAGDHQPRPSPAPAPVGRSPAPPAPDAARGTVLSGPVLLVLCPPAPRRERRPRNAAERIRVPISLGVRSPGRRRGASRAAPSRR